MKILAILLMSIILGFIGIFLVERGHVQSAGGRVAYGVLCCEILVWLACQP